jgi:CheY-like chemotaxis protein
MPEIVLLEGDWSSGDAIDASQRLMGDPEFAFKCRIVMLSRSTSSEYLITAAKAGVHEVIGKPVDMSKLIEQLWKHARKQFVPPPADVEVGGGGGSFDVGMMTGGGGWALPMLKGLVGPDRINESFINEILTQMGEDGMEVDLALEATDLSNILRIALNRLVQDADGDQAGAGPSFEELKKKKALGDLNDQAKSITTGGMESILENQADAIANEIEAVMDDILDEAPEQVAILPHDDLERIDPQVLNMTRLTTEMVHELMWDLGRPGAVSDTTLMTRIEDATEMLGDVLSSLPESEEE